MRIVTVRFVFSCFLFSMNFILKLFEEQFLVSQGRLSKNVES